MDDPATIKVRIVAEGVAAPEATLNIPAGWSTQTVDFSGVDGYNASGSYKRLDIEGSGTGHLWVDNIKANQTIAAATATATATATASASPTPSAAPVFLNFADNDALAGNVNSFGDAYGSVSCGQYVFPATGNVWSGLNVFGDSGIARVTDADHSVVTFDVTNPSTTASNVMVKLEGSGAPTALTYVTVQPGTHSASVDFSTVTGWTSSKVYKKLALFPGFARDAGGTNDTARDGRVYKIDNISVNGGTSSNVSTVATVETVGLATSTKTGLESDGCNNYTKSVAVGTTTTVTFVVKVNGAAVGAGVGVKLNSSSSALYVNNAYAATATNGEAKFTVTGLTRGAASPAPVLTATVVKGKAAGAKLVSTDSLKLPQTGTRVQAALNAVSATYESATTSGACLSVDVVNSTLDCAFEGAKASIATVAGPHNKVLKIFKSSGANGGQRWSGVNLFTYKSTGGKGFNGRGITFDYYNPNSAAGPVTVKLDGNEGGTEVAVLAQPGWSTLSVDVPNSDANKEYLTVVLFPNFTNNSSIGAEVANTGAEGYLVDNVQVAGTKLANAITVPGATTINAVPGDADIAFSATATFGTPKLTTSSGTTICTIVNGKVHVVGVGSCAVLFNVAGTTNVAATAQVTRTVVIAKLANPITLTNSATTAKTNATDIAFGATAASGNAVTVAVPSSARSICTVVSGKVHLVGGVGSCVITFSSAATTRYSAGALTRTLVISKP